MLLCNIYIPCKLLKLELEYNKLLKNQLACTSNWHSKLDKKLQKSIFRRINCSLN